MQKLKRDPRKVHILGPYRVDVRQASGRRAGLVIGGHSLLLRGPI